MRSGVHGLPQPAQLPVHAPPRAALVAERAVLGDRVPGVVGELARERELLRALACAVAGLLRQADAVEELAAKVEPDLRLLTSAWS